MENARVPINNKILNLPFKNTYSSHEWKRKTDFQSLKYGKRQKHKIIGFFSLKKMCDFGKSINSQPKCP